MSSQARRRELEKRRRRYKEKAKRKVEFDLDAAATPSKKAKIETEQTNATYTKIVHSLRYSLKELTKDKSKRRRMKYTHFINALVQKALLI